MDNLRKKYNEVVLNKKTINDRLIELSNNDNVREYLNLTSQSNDLNFIQRELYCKLRCQELLNCKHILVTTGEEVDDRENQVYKYCGCVKCGLDESLLQHFPDSLSFDERICYEFAKNNYAKGVRVNRLCDLEIARACYLSILERFPNIDDSTMAEYLMNEIDEILVSKNNSKKTLYLKNINNSKKNFDTWNGID